MQRQTPPVSRVDAGAQSRHFAHAFHEETLKRVLARAEGYVHRPRRHANRSSADANASKRTKGEEIRARIAANAQKRFGIAEAMKAEAGVRDHQLNPENGGGIAWTDRARILAPAGENRVQLATLAHECGHVFLHSIGTPGNALPGHVKEMEAESYAHQAFAAHGMRMPSQITAWGRRYVGQWVENDRAVGIAIDPRAAAYAQGTRSPYELLRRVPDTWRAAGMEDLELLDQRAEQMLDAFRRTHRRYDELNSVIWQRFADVGARNPTLTRMQWLAIAYDEAVRLSPERLWRRKSALQDRPALLQEAAGLLRLAGSWLWHGGLAGYLALQFGQLAGCPPQWCPSHDEGRLLQPLLTGLCIGLVIASLAVMWRTATRLGPGKFVRMPTFFKRTPSKAKGGLAR